MAAGAAPGKWSSGLFSCFDDCESCCLTLFCPCVAFGQVAETIDRGNTSCMAAGAVYLALMHFTGSLLTWIYSCTYRRKLRAQYGLPAEPCPDCCVHFFCEPCSLCQMHRELKNRGLNPSNGWTVNSQMTTSAPAPMQVSEITEFQVQAQEPGASSIELVEVVQIHEDQDGGEGLPVEEVPEDPFFNEDPWL